MKKGMIIIVATWLVYLMISTISWSQVVEKPTHHPGEWWEISIKTENAGERDPFYQLDGEYRIEVVKTGMKCLYKDAGKWTKSCEEAEVIILNTFLGLGEERYLRFPIAVADKWKYSFTDSEGRKFTGESVVAQFDKITVAGRTLDAYRLKRQSEWISRGDRHQGTISVDYSYAPECKCIPSLKLESGGHSWGAALMEIKLTTFKITK